MADDRHPQCVLVAPEMTTARALAEWLTDKGFPAEVVTPGPVATPGDSLGLSEETFTALEIRVADPEHVGPARTKIAEQKEALEALVIQVLKRKRADRTGTVTAVCEDCGKPSDWPATEMGTTQICPHCDSYMDVPDPEDDWGDIDFSGEEPETESQDK
ncbi:MAG: hypothetical protein JWO38_876 [Gemmataceae bacterium]|nr:hypothetical protein [Gemmataceae bacterium]